MYVPEEPQHGRLQLCMYVPLPPNKYVQPDVAVYTTCSTYDNYRNRSLESDLRSDPSKNHQTKSVRTYCTYVIRYIFAWFLPVKTTRVYALNAFRRILLLSRNPDYIGCHTWVTASAKRNDNKLKS